ncbi:unnamed protein product, partial [Trichogramma brassicae]
MRSDLEKRRTLPCIGPRGCLYNKQLDAAAVAQNNAGPAAAAAVGVTRGCGKSKSSPPVRFAIAVLFRPILLARPMIIALREGHATPTRLYCERLFFKFHVRVFVSPFRKRIAKHRSRVWVQDRASKDSQRLINRKKPARSFVNAAMDYGIAPACADEGTNSQDEGKIRSELYKYQFGPGAPDDALPGSSFLDGNESCCELLQHGRRSPCVLSWPRHDR